MRLYFARILTMLTMCSHMHIRYLDIEALISFVAIELSPYWAAVPVTALPNNDYCDSRRFLLSHAFKVITVAKSCLSLSVSLSYMIIWYPSMPKVLPSIVDQCFFWFIGWFFFFFFLVRLCNEYLFTPPSVTYRNIALPVCPSIHPFNPPPTSTSSLLYGHPSVH